jgi:hypothetical protein
MDHRAQVRSLLEKIRARCGERIREIGALGTLLRQRGFEVFAKKRRVWQLGKEPGFRDLPEFVYRRKGWGEVSLTKTCLVGGSGQAIGPYYVLHVRKGKGVKGCEGRVYAGDFRLDDVSGLIEGLGRDLAA